MKNARVFERKALKISQPSGRDLYLLTLTGEQLLQVAGISRVSRDEEGKLIGYQRPEVRKHVQEIADYLESPGMLLAHPLILSFTSDVRFVSSRGAKTSDGLAVAGILEIPQPTAKKAKPAWIVDGQQRALAVSLCKKRDFAVPICGFIADDVEIQRDQFLRVNNSRPLPRGLVAELLPEVSSPLPPKLAVKKLPSALCGLLNSQEDSPFKGMIRRASSSDTEKTRAVVADTVILKMIEDSITNPSGCLFPFRNIATGECDHVSVWQVLTVFWNAVRATFSEAWGKPPAVSRLMHGVGIRAMGKLMDRIMSSVEINDPSVSRVVAGELLLIKSLCRWTDGCWEELGGLEWNELQNLPKHHAMLSNYLIRSYIEKRQV